MNASIDLSRRAYRLCGYLSAMVPLVIQEYLLGQRTLNFSRLDLALILAVSSEASLYRSPGRTAQVVSVLVEALATMAFVPGGIDFLGLHFEVPPQQALAVLQEQQRRRSLPPGQVFTSHKPDKTAQSIREDALPSPTFQEIFRRRVLPPLPEL